MIHRLVNVPKKEALFFQIYRPFLLTQFLLSILLVSLFYFLETKSTRDKVEKFAAQELTVQAVDFENRYASELRSHHELFSSYLQDYLIAPTALQPMAAKRVEHQILRALRHESHYLSVEFILPSGERAIALQNQKRNLGAVDYSTFSDDTRSDIEKAKVKIFHALKDVELVLNAGPLSWFIPKRDIVSIGPIQRGDGQHVVMTGWPVMDLHTGSLGGVLLIEKDLSSLFRNFQGLQILGHETAWVLAPDGAVLRRPLANQIRQTKITTLPKTFTPQALAVHSESDVLIYRDFSILPDEPLFRVVLAIPAELIINDVADTAWILAYTLLASLSIILVVAWFVSRRVSKPILSLAEATQAFANNTLQEPVEISAKGEVQLLIKDFNSMVEKLIESRTIEAEIVQTNRALKEVSNELMCRKAAEREIFAAKEAAERASQAKSEFLAVMSHEIRTPMNGVIGLADILRENDLTDEQQEIVQQIQYSGKLLLSIINDILDFSKIEAGKLQVCFETVNLRQVLETTVSLMRNQAKSREIKLWIDDTITENIISDSGRVSQVLTNFLGNAIKFSDKDIAVNVTWATQQHPTDSTDDRHIQIEVIDQGVGIAPDKVDMLFEAFTQVNYTSNRQYGGTGLGLAISKALVEFLGGDIGADSEEGVGSRFWFTLPNRPATSIAETALSTPQDGTLQEQFDADILVVEDNAVNQVVVRRLITSLGCSVSLADSGKAALELLDNNTYDLIFMDCSMPVMDGYEATRIIRRLEQETGSARKIIIALTANVMSEDQEACHAAGMDDFLTKPIRRTVLQKTLARWLAKKPDAAAS